jgi:thioredoxin 1
MSTAILIKDQAEFETLRKTTSLLVVDCTANYSDRASVMKLDIDGNKPLAKEFGLKSIPAVLFFKAGELVETMIGVKTYAEFSATLEKFL